MAKATEAKTKRAARERDECTEVSFQLSISVGGTSKVGLSYKYVAATRGRKDGD